MIRSRCRSDRAARPLVAEPAGLASVVLGRTEDGTPWRVDLGISCLTAGLFRCR